MKRWSLLTRTVRSIIVLGMLAAAFSLTASAAPGDEILEETAAEIAEETGTTQVQTIRWEATLTNKVQVTTIETDELPEQTIRLQSGTKLTVVQRDYHEQKGISLCELEDGGRCWIANKFLHLTKALCTGAEGDYDKKTKEAFVNGMKIKRRKGDKLIWISLDKQRVNVFQGKKGNWKLIKTFLCSSGAVDTPTFDQTFRKKTGSLPYYTTYKIQKKQHDVQYGTNSVLFFYSFIYGYGIHKWPGTGRKQYIGKEPVSHSCVRLSKKNALWVYDDENIPVGTTVYVW